MTRLCFALALVALSGCNHHEALESCLPACDESDEQEFDRCVAYGDVDYDCRAGNRECCALAAECVGDIGTEVVDPLDAMCAASLEVSGCRPPCEVPSVAALPVFYECLAGVSSACPGGDEDCCAEYVGCLGTIGDYDIETSTAGCCTADDDCGDGEHCDVEALTCVVGSCAEGCVEGRVCDGESCTCRDGSTPVVSCPEGQACSFDGFCFPVDPCDVGPPCEDDQICSGGQCFDRCDDDADCADPRAPLCRAGVCLRSYDCEVDLDCPPGEYCAAPVCQPCDAGFPDDCGFGDSDCDGSVDEDCGDGCGDALIDPGEECDGPDTGAASCEDVGRPSGFVLCTADCMLDYAECSTEICFSMVDEDDDGLVDCEDDDCIGHSDCLFEDCGNGIDDDLDDLVDCDDDECAFSSICNPEICDNEADEDFDELVDCDDPDCEGTPHCCSLGRTDICNGIDDDCDGTRDEDDPEVGLGCGSSVGECRPGTLACVGGALTCMGGIPPRAELCNDLDDDCDGTIDGFAADVACDDGVFCNGFEYCSGACRPAEMLPCEDFEECTDDVCDEPTTSCTNDPSPADTPCGGGAGVCNGGGMCVVPA